MATTPRKRAAKKTAAAPANGAKRQYITAAHRADVAAITQRLYELADEHGWCDLFHTEMKALNETLTVKMDAPAETLEVEISLTLHMTGIQLATVDSVWGGTRREVSEADVKRIEQAATTALLNNIDGATKVEDFDLNC